LFHNSSPVCHHNSNSKFAEHDERHFAEYDHSRYYGEEATEKEEGRVRYNGLDHRQEEVRYYGQNGAGRNVRHHGQKDSEEEEVRNNGHVYLNCGSNLQQLLTDYVHMSTNPTYVILDSRSTPAMGSRFATDRLFKACMDHRYPHLIKFTKEASHNKVLFANGESSHVKEKLVIHVKNPKHPTGWITTSVDILEKGRVPILFPAEQMRKLRMNIDHAPAEFLTCPAFGLKRYSLSVATSNHPILEVMFLAQCGHA